MKINKGLVAVLIASATYFSGAVIAAAGDHRSTERAYWWFDGASPVGESTIVRSPGGISARFQTTGLPAGHAVTLWIMFFDNPAACGGQCTFPDDVGTPGAGFDFHFAGGHVVNGRKTTLTGHVQTGELSTSGWLEVGGPLPPQALTNPSGAQVILALHSHGPALQGQDLAAQMSSYLGGCVLPFLGPGGFAASPSDIPANEGECSTIQRSDHVVD